MGNKTIVVTVIFFSGSLCLAACPSADVTGDCLVNFLDFQGIASEGNLLDLHTMALQWLQPAEDDGDLEPLTILGRVETGADEVDSFAVAFVVVDKQRVYRTVFEYESKIILENISAAAFENIQLAMASWPDNMTVIDPRVDFGDVQITPGESATSIDTCTFRVDRSVPINPVEMTWHNLTTLGDMTLVPGGAFEMGDGFREASFSERPVHTVTVDSFYMGKYEITNKQYCAFLNSAYANGWISVTDGVVYMASSGTSYPYCDTHGADTNSQIDYSSGVFSVRTKSGRDMSHDPMLEVSWYGSVGYCNWRSQEEGKEQCYNLSTWNCDFAKPGYRLPTEAEWEYAARGGLSGRRFPWGDTISHSQANYNSSYSYAYDVSPTRVHHPSWNDGVYPYTSPVGSLPPNAYGLYDMIGNVFDWCNDWYAKYYYDDSPTSNPRGPITGSDRVLRGGGWGYYAPYCRVAYRLSYSPDYRDFYRGFRIVRSFEECQAPPLETVDDMEVYTPWFIVGNNIFEIWRDGMGNCNVGNGNASGANVSENVDSTYVLDGILLISYQSMRYDYDNDGIVYNFCTMRNEPRSYLYSKIEAQITDLHSGIGSNWNPCGTTQLVLNFFGMPGNAVEELDPLWVELKDAGGNSAKVVYRDGPGEDPQHLTEASWHEWIIDLADFADDGVDTTDLASIAIGVGTEGATTQGGSGTLYFDEIHLATSGLASAER